MMIKKTKEKGLTFIEVLVVVAVGAVVLVALFTLAVRTTGLSRIQAERGRVGGEAREEMERMSDMIRGARNVDFDGDGEYDGGEERWIRRAGPGEIVIYSNADTDSEPEMVHYWVDGDDLMRGVTEFSEGEEVSRVVARGFRNAERVPPLPLFTYYSLGGTRAEVVDAFFDLKAIDRVNISFVIDIDESQSPAAEISTMVVPRRGYLQPTTGSAPPLPPEVTPWPTS